MKFSVLMAVYRGDKPNYLSECLSSLSTQTLPPSEIVVVCDGEVPPEIDKTLRSFHNLPIKLLKYSGYEKLPGALNLGIELCEHSIIGRMDADDVCLNERFEIQIPRFVSSNCSVLGCSIDEFDSNPNKKIQTRYANEIVDNCDLYLRNPMNHMTVVFDKKAVQKVGGYQFVESFEDWHLWLRLCKAGFTLENIAQSLVRVRVGNGFILRRSGIQYAKKELVAFVRFYREGLVPLSSLLIGILFRVPLRLVPRLLQSIYSLFARKQSQNKWEK